MSWKLSSIHPGIYWNILEFHFFIAVRTLFYTSPNRPNGRHVLSIQTRRLYEAFSHAVITALRLFTRILPTPYTARYLFIRLSQLGRQFALFMSLPLAGAASLSFQYWDRECNCWFFFISTKFNGLIFNMEHAI